MEIDLRLLISKAFKKLYLWASESTIKSLVSVFFIVIFGFPLISYLQKIVSNFQYLSVIDSIINFFNKNFILPYYIILFCFVIIFLFIFYIIRKLHNFNLITENFNDDLSKWSIPLYSSWTIHPCGDVSGKMLRITNSSYPGTLKAANAWFDYEFSFSVKIDKDVSEKNQKIGIIVRSENNLKGIMLQFEKEYFRPHLLNNGIFFLDNNQDQQLPTILAVDEWIKFKVIVKGNNIEVDFDNYKINYRIPTKDFNVENYLLRDRVTLKELEDSDKTINKEQQKLIKKLDEAIALKVGTPQRDEKMKEFYAMRDKMPTFIKTSFDYQKGSVGFRESGSEKINVRNVSVKKIQ